LSEGIEPSSDQEPGGGSTGDEESVHLRQRTGPASPSGASSQPGPRVGG
jgi:hypothetical protein